MIEDKLKDQDTKNGKSKKDITKEDDTSKPTVPPRKARQDLLNRAIINYHVGHSNITPTRRRPSKKKLRHSSTVDLTHSMKRQRKEDIFSQDLLAAFSKISSDLDLKLDTSQLYNCISLVEMMRTTKGIVICGPTCSGKT